VVDRDLERRREREIYPGPQCRQRQRTHSDSTPPTHLASNTKSAAAGTSTPAERPLLLFAANRVVHEQHRQQAADDIDDVQVIGGRVHAEERAEQLDGPTSTRSTRNR